MRTELHTREMQTIFRLVNEYSPMARPVIARRRMHVAIAPSGASLRASPGLAMSEKPTCFWTCLSFSVLARLRLLASRGFRSLWKKVNERIIYDKFAQSN